MTEHAVCSKNEWLEARKELLRAEKDFTRLRDELSARRRALPWLRIEKTYSFDTTRGKETLSQLFRGKTQLVVYHFMFGPDWEAGCKSCSFWADNFNGIVAHLGQRDVGFAAISRAPLAKLQGFARRLGWSFEWASSLESDFNFDFHVSFEPDDVGRADYNYRPLRNPLSELPGISVFTRDARGALFHTYSTYGRGLDLMNTAYNYLDLVPKGRDEADLPARMAWVKLRDLYEP
jgi:predicted dithiol-disulfide oxidoreductase (DUF899 family)